MIKFVCMLKRKKGLTFEQFKHYYENNHAPLASSYLTKALHYQRRYLQPAMPGYLDVEDELPGMYDCFTEVWFENRADMDANLAVLSEKEAAAVVIADEEKFLDRSQLRFFIIDDECKLA
jgi:EthD domain